MSDFARRTVLAAIGATTSLAGLSGLTAAQNDADEDGPGDGDEPEYGDWFDGVENGDETVDETGEDEVVVAVGAGDRGYQFDPPAVRVSEGTTVVWEWTGVGGRHNVVHDPEAEAERLEESADETDADDDPVFESELTDEAGHTFEHQFDDEGTFLYVCTPHRTVGMRGAVVVAGEDEGDG